MLKKQRNSHNFTVFNMETVELMEADVDDFLLQRSHFQDQ